jgi:uncharacterized protein (TIRG00374 family)
MKKNIIWLFVTLAIFTLIFQTTDPKALYSLNWLYFLSANIVFLASTVLWALAWKVLMPTSYKDAILINTKSLAGFFAPFGFGADLLRAYFGKKKHISATQTLSASFTVKFFKFLIVFFWLLISIVMLGLRSNDVLTHLDLFITALLLTMLGAIIILLFRFKKFIRFLERFSDTNRFDKLYSHLEIHFSGLRYTKTFLIILALLVSTGLEIWSIDLAFQAINYQLPLLHLFILGAILSSLVLITFTPQGIGFVEAGGFFALSLGYFSVPIHIIGSFLIVWNLIRLWVPSIVAGMLAFLDR